MAARLEASRKAHRRQMTKLLTRASEFLDSLEGDYQDGVCDSLTTTFTAITGKQQVLQQLDAQILESVDDSKMEDFIIEYDEYMQSVAQSLAKLQGSFQRLSIAHRPPTMAASQSHSQSQKPKQVHLPKLNLPTFSGDVLQWQTFIDGFKATIDSDTNLKDVIKFQYLRAQLTGEAAQVIAGLPLTSDNYHHALALLKERFGQQHQMVKAYMKALWNITPPLASDVISLKRFYDTLESYVRGLESLGKTEDSYGDLLVPVILEKMSPNTRVQLVRDNGGSSEWTLQQLRISIRREITTLETGLPASALSFSESNSTAVPHTTLNAPPSTAAFVTDTQGHTTQFHRPKSPSNRSIKCVYCKEDHHSYQCSKVTDLNQRLQIIKRDGRCYNCLGNHRKTDCRSKFTCRKCKKRHHTSLCGSDITKPRDVKKDANEKQPGPQQAQTSTVPRPPLIDNSSSPTVIHSMTSASSMVLLKTAVAKVSALDHITTATIMFDEGATRSFITKDLAQKLQLEPSSHENIALSTFGESNTRSKSLEKVNVTLHTNSGPALISALVVPRISVPMKNLITSKIQNLPHIAGLELAHPVTGVNSFEITLLIGADYYWHFVGDAVIRGPGPTAVSSRFGYLLSGPLYTQTEDADMDTPVFHVTTAPNLDNDVKAYWDLETIGIRDDPTDNKYPDLTVEEYCANYISLHDRQYVAKLPWKSDHPPLPTNYHVCNKRTRAMVRKLPPEHRRIYDRIIKDQLARDFITMVSNDNTSNGHYIPHHAVRKDSPTTPIRVVYDCSFKTRDNPSLNNCLQSGPCLLNDMTSVMIRFRMHTYAITADIEKAFLHIGLHETDQEYTKFLWLTDPNDPDSPFDVYKFKAILFGATCSPFILNATIRAHLDLNHSQIAKDMQTNIYVDNLLTGDTDEASVIHYYNSANEIMQTAGFNLREWYTNSPQLQKLIHAHTNPPQDSKVNILGMLWDTDNDVMEYRHEIQVREPDQTLTAREVVSRTCKVFDPLGYLSPVTVKAKTFIQNLSAQKNLDWDSPVSTDLLPEWDNIQRELHRTREIIIPRQFVPQTDTDYELHTFSDASPQAYGAAVYIRCGNNTALVMAKTRVKPLRKQISLPRLELLGIHIATLLTQHVKKALSSITPISKCFLWTDSQICIHWVTGDKKLPIFVHNRVAKIRQFLDSDTTNDIRYCPTSDNPSDLLTRGITVRQLTKADLWWHGPNWLKTGHWPFCDLDTSALHAVIEQERDPVVYVTVNKTDTEPTNYIGNVIQLERYSDYTKLLRITALVTRFITNIRSSCDTRLHGPITTAEIQSAELAWLRNIQAQHFPSEIASLRQKANTLGPLSRQLRMFMDDNNLLRVGGRLHNAPLDYSAKFPILLPTRHKFTELVIRDAHQRVVHAGVNSTVTQIRRRYWIPKIRAVVKSALRVCVVCKKVMGKPFNPPIPAPLQSARLLHAPPFTVTGIDFTGALYIKNVHGAETKVYVCLFTCAVTRAIHLELVPDMTTRTFLNAFRRFVSRRSLPHHIISDNATTYLAAADEIHKLMHSEEVARYLANHRITWTNIVKRASWYGGFYERLIGLTKTAIKKVLGRSFVTYDELHTVLCEIEASLNERPLTYVSSDCEDLAPLTPSQLLHGHSVTLLPHTSADEYEDPTFNVDHVVLNERATYIAKLHNNFWNRWTHDYLTALREQDTISGKGTLTNSIRVGDIVLVHHDIKPRLHWPLACVTKLHHGNDGLVRSVDIRTQNGVTNRPISKLYPLEINSGDVAQDTHSDTTSEPTDIDREPVNNDPDGTLIHRPVRASAARARERIKDWISE